MSTPRNDPCPCGSGKKYKQCCLKGGGVGKTRRAKRTRILAVVLVLVTVAVAFVFGRETAILTGVAGALVIGAYLFVFTDPPPPTGGGNPGAINFGR